MPRPVGVTGRTPRPLPALAALLLALGLAPGAAAAPDRDGLVGVVVRLDAAPLARYAGGLPGLPATRRAATGVARLDARSARSRAYLAHLDAELGAFEITARGVAPAMRALYRHRAVLGAVTLRVPPDAVARLAALPGVRAVYPDGIALPDTERSPRFIGAPRLWRELGGVERAGEGVVVGVLDTGIWPEHPSFSDPDPAGQAYPPPPATWNGGAGPECEAPGAGDPCAPLACSRKLVGAFRFLATYEAAVGLLPGECRSARDTEGHGTHTASTAAGNAGVVSDLVARRPLAGIAPRAHVAMYRVCAEEGCFFSDSVAAIDQAVLDGVDVINFSIGGGADPYADVVALAFRDAYDAGVFVAASAGNSGPGANTVAHRAPWVTTVGASTETREFQGTVVLRAAGGARLRTRGASITRGNRALGEVPAVLAAALGDTLCLGPFAPGTFTRDEIVACQRGVNARTAKSFAVAQGGAGGMLLYNPIVEGLATDNHFVPSLHLEAAEGAALVDFMLTHGGVTAALGEPRARRRRGDVMASFSSRGGSAQSLGVSKPDVTAPGVQILAGNSPQKHALDGAAGAPGTLFQAIQGTSMSSPHVAGAAALLRAQHPEWTPGRIKSALMTSARTRRVVKEDGATPADAYDMGSGRIDLTRAGDPGLTFDASAEDFVAHASDLWNTNYPSISLPAIPGASAVTVERVAHNEEDRARRYRIRVRAAGGPSLAITTEPERRLDVPAGGDAALLVTVDMSAMSPGEVGMATLELRAGGHHVHLPIVAVRGPP